MTDHKPPLLISACLLGQPVRYDGQSKSQNAACLTQLASHYQLLPVCPECAGGLPVPRPAAEIIHGDGRQVLRGQARVVTASGEDVSQPFRAGAEHTLQLAKQYGCQLALLKANSPSCGNHDIYDGSFSQQLRHGQGVTAALLQQHGLQVFNENEIDQLLALVTDMR
ncbi:DUF523 domain-containing protein [Aquitalea sp. ASV15]|uniref:DUF523 domain-containing protein n=1 Tax=Aquitalea sp. ASV15 TaxID=2795104 RepID=UPI0018EBDD67